MKHTPGPWQWSFNGWSFQLETVGRGRLIVMDFVRMGMSGAQPRFAKWEGEDRGRLGGIMFKAQELGELHDHPDARLITAAPNLLRVLKMWVDEECHCTEEGVTKPCIQCETRAAIAEAEKSPNPREA